MEEATKYTELTQLLRGRGSESADVPPLSPAWISHRIRRDERPRHDAWCERLNGRRSGRHQGNGARIPGGHAAPRAAGHEHGDKNENGRFQNIEGAGERKQTQSSAMLECTSRALPCVRLAFVLVGGTAETGRHRVVYTCNKRKWSPFWYTHNGHSTHFAADST